MFGQLLPNKNKIATMWRDTYYAKFGFKFWNLNMAWIRISCLKKYMSQGVYSGGVFYAPYTIPSLTLMSLLHLGIAFITVKGNLVIIQIKKHS
jgi:hypothetical protein